MLGGVNAIFIEAGNMMGLLAQEGKPTNVSEVMLVTIAQVTAAAQRVFIRCRTLRSTPQSMLTNDVSPNDMGELSVLTRAIATFMQRWLAEQRRAGSDRVPGPVLQLKQAVSNVYAQISYLNSILVHNGVRIITSQFEEANSPRVRPSAARRHLPTTGRSLGVMTRRRVLTMPVKV
jgi:hypothetical protein